MNDDDLENLLSGAFAAQARASVPDNAAPPAPRFEEPVAVPTTPRRRRFLAPLAAAAAVIAAVSLGAVALNHDDSRTTASGHRTGTTSQTASVQSPGDVHVRLLNQDGLTYGVGMPVIAYFSRRITSGTALQNATTVTVNGKPEKAAWYFERSAAYKNYPYEAHLRLHSFWPADSTIHVAMPTRGLSAGKGMSFDDSLTLDFTTGDSHIAVVDDTTHLMTVTSNGQVAGRYRVSLGSAATPTSRGIKVIMEKGANICMHGPGYSQCGIKYTQRLTYSGEYLHSAPWNEKNIKAGIDSSNGCTNLMPAAAKALYEFTRIGDVVEYANADGPAMTLGEGYGDWNVSWAQWQTGGLVPTH